MPAESPRQGHAPLKLCVLTLRQLHRALGVSYGGFLGHSAQVLITLKHRASA